ncbi:MAG TPA: tetratricopeptide repeat protein [Chitinophagaceae bacterium]|nr:MAG: tetratricopeptide domain-containing protein [Bacteroidetes bacterium OLB11]HMN32541.1 tetratricopeptide repeat protein [Chitinophagaceae bacterium]
MKKWILILFCFFQVVNSNAQDQLLNLAKQYLSMGDYEKAATTYKQLYEYNEKDIEIILDYNKSLIGIKDYKTAEKVLKQSLKNNNEDSRLQFELGMVYQAQGEGKKAKKVFKEVIDQTPSNDIEIKKTASLFAQAGMYDEAIEIYSKAKSKRKENPYLYALELAFLYDKKGDSENAIESLIDLYISNSDKGDDIKATFRKMFNTADKLESFRKRIMKRASSNPNIVAYPDLLAWLYIQQNDYENAYIQIKAIDNQFQEQGRRVLGFARMALREKKFTSSLLAYDFVIGKGKENPYFQLASSEKLTCLKEQLKNTPNYTQDDVNKVVNAYELFLDETPAYKTKETIREYAELQARYAHQIEKAIEALRQVVKSPQANAVFRGQCKLDMGDYELIQNEIWESTLLYSQVDKEFKNDMLGEEARFRNAKLSYYAGDFNWAQGQLDVLKASTSELIANDALNLSVLITENNPIADSNANPLLMFARADLLEFQNKNEEAISVLDSIESEYPQHPLLDDILMERAKIAIKKMDYSEAAKHLQKITTQYPDDVLADDALYNLAFIYENHFQNIDEAKRLYELLIVKYPGSTYVNEARKRFRVLRGDMLENEL